MHALVCNAGLQIVSGLQQTADGVEMTFGVNHLGHFALVDGLLEHLVAPARIVLVASGTHDPEKLTGMPHPPRTPLLRSWPTRNPVLPSTAGADTPPRSCATCCSPMSSTAGSATVTAASR